MKGTNKTKCGYSIAEKFDSCHSEYQYPGGHMVRMLNMLPNETFLLVLLLGMEKGIMVSLVQ
jgi:hypothetical protein